MSKFNVHSKFNVNSKCYNKSVHKTLLPLTIFGYFWDNLFQSITAHIATKKTPKCKCLPATFIFW